VRLFPGDEIPLGQFTSPHRPERARGVLGWTSATGSPSPSASCSSSSSAPRSPRPLWANEIAETTRSRNQISALIEVDGDQVPVVSFEGVPIGRIRSSGLVSAEGA
jgi:hypothetical protein